jgi:hypothetical protein
MFLDLPIYISYIYIIFELRNIFSYMNTDLEKYKKIRNDVFFLVKVEKII